MYNPQVMRGLFGHTNMGQMPPQMGGGMGMGLPQQPPQPMVPPPLMPQGMAIPPTPPMPPAQGGMSQPQTGATAGMPASTVPLNNTPSTSMQGSIPGTPMPMIR